MKKKKIHLDKGQSLWFADPGEVPEGYSVFCGLCGEQTKESRNNLSARCFAEAMGGGKTLHDTFSCPNRNKKWHKRVEDLRYLAKMTPSKKLAKLYQEECKEILKKRKNDTKREE